MRALTFTAVVTTVALLVCAPSRASAQAATSDYPVITDRHFALDAYQGSTVASYRIVGMGGTSLATAEGAASMSSNPASVASRLATWNDWFEWDFSADTYQPDLASDFDNNGVTQDSSANTLAGNGAIMMYLGEWGTGLSVISEERRIELDTGDPAKLTAELVRLSLGRSVRARSLTFGVSLAAGNFTIAHTDANGNPGSALVDVSSTSLDAGFLWRPPARDLRVGARASLPLTASLDSLACDPMNCGGYILPERVEFPWSLGAGVAWRRGPSRWNTVVHDDWRDEKSLILAADLLVTGGVREGAGIEAFLDHRYQQSGRHALVSLRAGAEYEWVPGWLRVRGGSYWEPGRFEGVSGRAHATAGLDVRVWSFCFWGDRYRLRLSFATDVAPRYTNVIFSLGFWH